MAAKSATTTADLLALLEEANHADLPAPLTCRAGERQVASLWAGYGRVTELAVLDGSGKT